MPSTPTLTISGYGSVDGARQDFNFVIPEGEFVYDIEKQILMKVPGIKTTDNSTFTWVWTAAQDKTLSIPLSLPIVGKISIHPELATAEAITLVLAP